MTLDTSGLTLRQAELLRFIAGYVAEHGISPSYDEMKAALGLASKSGIHRLLAGLEERGRISRTRGGSRNVSMVPPAAISIFVDQAVAVRIEVAEHVTADWLLQHGDTIESALNARLAAIVGRDNLRRAA